MCKILLFIASFLMFSFGATAQPFKFHYTLKKCLSETEKGTVIETSEDNKTKIPVYRGFIYLKPIGGDISTDTASIYNFIPKKEMSELKIIDRVKVGKIAINEDHDTLFFSPWPDYSDKPDEYFKDKNDKVTPIDEEHKYSFAINWSKNKNWFGYYVIKIPFRYGQFAITSIPFRFNLKDGIYKSGFLNANISYLYICGKTKFYESKFIEPRTNYWGFGPYIGASTIEEDKEKKTPNIFAFNYGLNLVRSIRNINLSLALGAESGFTTKENAFIPYWGIGIGIKLIEFYEPENVKE